MGGDDAGKKQLGAGGRTGGKRTEPLPEALARQLAVAGRERLVCCGMMRGLQRITVPGGGCRVGGETKTQPERGAAAALAGLYGPHQRGESGPRRAGDEDPQC